MYVVFQTGGKQYRVFENQMIFVERLDVSIGDQVQFDRILIIKSDDFLKIGNPFIKDGVVIAIIVAHGLNKKIEIVKFRRRKHYRKHQGHRQNFTKIKILNFINLMTGKRYGT